MNYDPGGHAAADPWCYRRDGAGAAEAGSNTSSSFADMIADYSTDDLFELAWEQGGGGAGGAPGSTASSLQAGSCLWSPAPPPPEVQFEPPSEDEMAAWIRAIVKSEELAFKHDDQQTASGGRDVPAKGSSDASTTTMEKKEKQLPMAVEGMDGHTKQQETRKTAGGGGSPKRSHTHHGEAHSLTEKRRRHKINEKLRTLQQLVPGCDKCNQASTLDKTIQYMKSLQHQVQAMCVGGPARPMPPVAVPMMPAAPVVVGAAPTTMVPFRAMIQLPHYPAAAVPAVIMPAAAAAPLYPAAAPAAPAGGVRPIASHRQGSSSSKGNGGSRSLRQKQGK